MRDGEGTTASRAHLDGCALCRGELDAIRQRVAALRALPTRRPPRDRWPRVREQLAAARRRDRFVRVGWASLTVAAGLAVAIGVRQVDGSRSPGAPAARVAEAEAIDAELAALVDQSQQLETALRDWNPRGRVQSGRTASVIADLEDRIAAVDAGIAQEKMGDRAQQTLVTLWRNRVQLMDALVSAHVTRASYVGF